MTGKVQNLDQLLEEIETLFDVMETLGLMESRGSFPVEMPEVLVEATVRMSGDCPCAAREKLQLAMRGAETNETMLAAKQRELEADLEASKRAGPEFASLYAGVESELEKVKARRMKNLKDLDAIDSMHSDYFAKYKPGDDVYDRRAHAELLRSYGERIKKRMTDAEAGGSPDPQMMEKLRRRSDRISTAQAENSRWMKENDPNWEKTMDAAEARAKEKGKSKKASGDDKAADARIKERMKDMEAAGGTTGAAEPAKPESGTTGAPEPAKPESGTTGAAPEAPKAEPAGGTGAAEAPKDTEAQKEKYVAYYAQPGTVWKTKKGKFGGKNKTKGKVNDGSTGVRYFENENDAKQYATKGLVKKKTPVARQQEPGTIRKTGEKVAAKKQTGKPDSVKQLRYQDNETEAKKFASLRGKGTRRNSKKKGPPKVKPKRRKLRNEEAMLEGIEQFLYERVYSEITELADARKPLWIFDFDDTLAVDTARVRVVDKKSGKTITTLSTDEFKSYSLKGNEKFDMGTEAVKGSPIPATLKIMRSVLNRGGKTVVLTGRSYGETAKKYLESMGIDVEVVAVGKKSGGSHAGVAQAKADWIQDQIDQGYNDIEFHDDNKLNLEYAKRLAVPGKVRIRTKHIQYSPKRERALQEKVYAKSDLGKWFNDESATKEPGWDRYNTKGERIGKCGDAAEGEAYAACLSKQKAEKLGKKGISSFVRRKRAAQRKGGMAKKGEGEPGGGAEPIRVSTGIDKIKEAWSKKYKQSIDCENPKGFSQRAHCQGKEKTQE